MTQPTPSAASPPWHMAGETAIAVVRARPDVGAEIRSRLPRGVAAVGARGGLVVVVTAASVEHSPVGPYVELSVGAIGRIGVRPGLCVVLHVVSIRDAGRPHRAHWGLPATFDPTLRWSSAPDATTLTSGELGVVVRGSPVPGRGVPAAVPLRLLQRRPDGVVVAPRRMVGRVRRARVEIAMEPPAGVGAGDDRGRALLSLLVGDHAGLLVSGARLTARPARRPTGLWSSLRAPLPLPERAMTVPSPGA